MRGLAALALRRRSGVAGPGAARAVPPLIEACRVLEELARTPRVRWSAQAAIQKILDR